MSIVQTVSATETFDEKIAAAQERVAPLERYLLGLTLGNATRHSSSLFIIVLRAVLFFAFWTGLVVGSFLVITWGVASHKIDPLFSGVTVFSGIALVIAKKFYKEPKVNGANVKDPKAEAELANLKSQIENWKIEKRNFLLAHNVNIVETDHVLKDTLKGQIGGDEKECPRCAEFVKGKAKVCRFCGYEFEAMNA